MERRQRAEHGLVASQALRAEWLSHTEREEAAEETRLERDGQENSKGASSKNCQVALRNTALGIIIFFKDIRLLILKNKESF